MKKPIGYGIIASLFFAFTFILNSSMNISGGSWLWSASLRYIFMLPLLYIVVLKQKGVKEVLQKIKQAPLAWFVWSSIGFGLFYIPLTWSSKFGPSWLVAGCWQITIVMGILLTPLFKEKLPVKSLLYSCVILIGVAMIQYEQATSVNVISSIVCIGLILIAATAYPLGNRKMMRVCNGELTTTQRVFGMTLCSMPVWITLSLVALMTSGMPSGNQVMQSSIVALFSGVIATILFFKATDLTKSNAHNLAIVEATQAGEVLFTVLGEIFILGGAIPSMIGIIGLLVIIIGMLLNSLIKA